MRCLFLVGVIVCFFTSGSINEVSNFFNWKSTFLFVTGCFCLMAYTFMTYDIARWKLEDEIEDKLEQEVENLLEQTEFFNEKKTVIRYSEVLGNKKNTQVALTKMK